MFAQWTWAAPYLLLFVALGTALWRPSHAAARIVLGGAILLAVGLGQVAWYVLLAACVLELSWRVGAHLALDQPRLRLVYCAGLFVLAVILVLHKAPGFSPVLVQEHFGRHAQRPLWWHFDKGLAAFLLLQLMTVTRPPALPSRYWASLSLGLSAIIAAALIMELGQWHPALPTGWPAWVIGNLFLTVIAEEALFRAGIQAWLARRWQARPMGSHWACYVSAVLFGLAHWPWGEAFAALAVVAGLLYGELYRRGGLLWAVAGHAMTNTALLLLLDSPLG